MLEPDWRVSNFNRVKRNLFLLGYSLKETQYSRDAVAKISDAKKKKIFFGSCFFVWKKVCFFNCFFFFKKKTVHLGLRCTSIPYTGSHACRKGEQTTVAAAGDSSLSTPALPLQGSNTPPPHVRVGG